MHLININCSDQVNTGKHQVTMLTCVAEAYVTIHMNDTELHIQNHNIYTITSHIV